SGWSGRELGPWSVGEAAWVGRSGVRLWCGGGVGPVAVALAQRPGGAGVLEAKGDEAAQVEGGGAVVQPGVVLGGSGVAESAVVADEPGDGAFDHGAVSSVFGPPVRV